MNTFQKRFLLFLFGCIGTRLSLTVLAKTLPLTYLPVFGFLALIPAIGFMVIYVFGLRQTGGEVFGDRIWWNDFRPLHAGLYGLFAYLAITKNSNAWIVLLVDTVLGLGAFLTHHYKEGNLIKLSV